MSPPILEIPVVDATRENIAPYGLLIDTTVPEAGLSIPFYKGAVDEGHNLPFVYTGKAVVRTARIHPRSGDITWLERHMRMTQLFIGLGDAPFGMVLGKPNHAAGKTTPDAAEVVGFRFPPGHGLMIHLGTWHDFPMALDRSVTVLTANSDEVVEALATQKGAEEMDRGDVFKIDVAQRINTLIRVKW